MKDWGPVGGSLEFGETIQESAVRKAREEAGLNVRLLRLVAVDQFWYAGEFRGVGYNFLAAPEPSPQEVRIPEYDGATAFLDYRWVTRAEAAAYQLPENRWELWIHRWPADIQETLVRRIDFDERGKAVV